ncbi:protein quick-to-court isoform X1 [Periplaneta americana]|uniref:protein quick-to-court isoform X1 n=1 Tax=Periplaneta americana TaxID=6978 RepID=UPI0037E91BEC
MSGGGVDNGVCKRKSNDDESRIPVPSPGMFRRSASMRLRGERPCSRSFPAPISETGQSCAKPWPGRPTSRHRSQSVSSSHLLGTPTSTLGSYPHTPTPSPEDAVGMDDDMDSLKSFGSVCSAMSCDHAYFARNGTTFSGRRMKYVVHCSPHMDGTDEYLTPTQRANRQIRRLKALLAQAQKDMEAKDQDIIRLTKEVVELRLYKAALAGPKVITDSTEDIATAQSSDETDAKEISSLQDQLSNDDRKESKDVAAGCEVLETASSILLDNINTTNDLPSSLADSGHFEDIASSSVHSKDSLTHLGPLPHSPSLAQSSATRKEGPAAEDREGERTRIVTMYEKRLEEMQRNHVDECQEMKERHNDKVENLLQRLSDVNNRYCELRVEYDRAQDRIRELEKDTESLRKSLEEQEERHKSMYLKMYMKGQEAAKFEHADQVLEFAHRAPTRVSVPELLQQLQVTENELENIKDTDHQQTDKTKPALLSAKEAISLWILGTRKAMYRRIVESRTGKGEMDPEITLQFLKSAIYYFLTDKENHQGHLNAIESILGYNENERLNIEKMYRSHTKK